jgi:hypothetical protein
VAILLRGTSHGNALASNRLEDNEVCDVWLRQGTFNNVVVEPNDTVLDKGRRNLVVSQGSCGPDASALEAEGAVDQIVLPEKLKVLLEEFKRLTEAGKRGTPRADLE